MNELAVFWPAGYKLDLAVGSGEQGVVFTTAHVLTGVKFRTALAYDDIARLDRFAAVAFDTQILGV